MKRLHACCLLLLALSIGLGLTQVVAGCATNPATGSPEVVLMSEEDELQIGRELDRRIQAQEALLEDDRLQQYVRQVGEKVAASSHRSELIYRFRVIDRPQVNAFALPGGYIYIYRGVLAYMNSEAELAAVLAHEIGHVTARHTVRQHRNATLASLLVNIIAARAGTPYAGDIANLLGVAFVAGYGRELELEADGLGAEYLARAGYETDAMLRVIDVLKYQEEYAKARAKAEGRKPVTYHGVFSTHPKNDSRLQEVVAAARKARETADPRIGRDEFLARIDGMTYGFSEKEGIPRGNRFYHRKLDFGFAYPEGWLIENQSGRVLGYAPQGAAEIQLTVEDLNKRIPPAEFARERLNMNDLRQEKTFEINGLTAYSALAPKGVFNSWNARLGIVYHDGRAYVFWGEPKDGKEPADFAQHFDATLRSFHKLRGDEAEAAREWKLRLLKADGSVRYQILAGQSPLGADASAQLRLINQQYPDGEPKAGDTLKIVQ
ncbi:MAG: M48 family metalloprotease [Nevskiales bacterium]